jgi:hypothetical protein
MIVRTCKRKNDYVKRGVKFPRARQYDENNIELALHVLTVDF